MNINNNVVNLKKGREMVNTVLKEAINSNTNIDQKKLAQELGVAEETVSRHLNGKTSMSIEQAKEYERILGVTAESLLINPDPLVISAYAYVEDNGASNVAISENKDEDKFILPPIDFKKQRTMLMSIANNHYKSKDGSINLKDPKNIQFNTLIIMDSEYNVEEAHKFEEEWCYLKISDEDVAKDNGLDRSLHIGLPYKEPYGKHTIEFPISGVVVKDVYLEWAYPIYGVVNLLSTQHRFLYDKSALKTDNFVGG